MHRSPADRVALATAAATAAVVLAGCASPRPGTGDEAAPPAPPRPSVTEARDDSAGLREAEDAACATATAGPSDDGTDTASPSAEPVGDQPPNYADNNAYRRALPLKGVNACRGDVHVTRLTEGLKRVPADRAEVDAALSRLGYGHEVERINTVDGTVRFDIGLGGVCVTGTLAPGHRPTVEAHGPYLEGGCAEPAYGH
ncbi:hypothetical protein [Streptomyces sp. S.PNR 29]|uniref:hypothetical protein n=1 Tax=Streptomyces sp. S.PNR 29 TaxID=2973805 RepID=UPI0025AFA41F|nr:hypothetical protein [Streptomyces sp. S.PNR 29]MDN0197659.1 hypothetical protein [Streptomyces sp. S.PNR 29]